MSIGPSDILKRVEDEGFELVDLRFCDLPGQVQHFTVPRAELTEETFGEGFGFDGSSIRGFQEIQESDMILIPDPATAFEDPFLARKTLVMYCFVHDPVTGDPYGRDPRYVAERAETWLKTTNVADTSYWGPETEFYIFDSARFSQSEHEAFYQVDSIEGAWNTGRDESDGNLAYKPRYKEGYFPVPPTDHYQDLRSEMVALMEQAGISVEVHHHEVGTAGQAEIDLRYDTLLRMADKVMTYKYIVKNVAWQAGKTVTFMPKPIFEDNGSGMHTHQSIWQQGRTLMFEDDGYGKISETAKYYIGGLLEHAPALLAFTAPTTNSYRRLVPGYEAPVNLVYSMRNRSAAVRVPVYSQKPETKRVEFRCPDPSCNPYLAFAAMLMAGMDGVLHKTEPPAPIDKDLYDLPSADAAALATVPASLEEALGALEKDHAFLLEGGVFTEELIEAWISYKWEHEVNPLRLRPHPFEFYQYYDI